MIIFLKNNFNQKFAERESWMVKNAIVAYLGLNNFKKLKKLFDERID